MQGCYFVCPTAACAEVQLEGGRCASLRLLFSSGTRWRYFSHLLLPTTSATSPALPRGHLSTQPVQHPAAGPRATWAWAHHSLLKYLCAIRGTKPTCPSLWTAAQCTEGHFLRSVANNLCFPRKVLGAWEFCTQRGRGEDAFRLPKLPASASMGNTKQR